MKKLKYIILVTVDVLLLVSPCVGELRVVIDQKETFVELKVCKL